MYYFETSVGLSTQWVYHLATKLIALTYLEGLPANLYLQLEAALVRAQLRLPQEPQQPLRRVGLAQSA